MRKLECKHDDERGRKPQTGNIRSINVDYFNSLHSHKAAESGDSDRQGNANGNAPNLLHGNRAAEQQQQQQQQQRQQQQQLGSSQPRFASLNAAILESVEELSRACGGQGVHVGALLAHLGSRYAHLLELPAVEFVDCAINGLLRSSLLKVRPMTQQQIERSPWKRRNQEAALQSVFMDQLLALAGDQSAQGGLCDREQSEQMELRSPVFCSSSSSSSECPSAATNKSKSTTLDSGIQTWDLVSSSARDETSPPLAGPKPGQREAASGRQQEERRQRGRGFSLARSLSFRPKRATSLAPAGDRWTCGGQRAAAEPQSAGQVERQTRQSEEATKRSSSTNFSSLFRSKSMRIISSGKEERFRSLGGGERADGRAEAGSCDRTNGGWTGRRQATIDYLATAQPHKRGFSMRRNSLVGCPKEELGGGKIALFLRRLFSVGRPQAASVLHETSAVGAKVSNANGDPGGKLACAAPSGAERRAWPERMSSGRGRNSQRRPSGCSNGGGGGGGASSTSSTSYCSSSGTNSLIEILACSPELADSKRPLREEKALDLNRATCRLIKRSDSDLSRNSEASCATTKSTVSQQLRRHLDEAYKRHRKCTSQREREFIDSINVLRQASRHALQNSRSSSKTRNARSTGSKSSASDDTRSSSSANWSSFGGGEKQTTSCNCNVQSLPWEMQTNQTDNSNKSTQFPRQHSDLMQHSANSLSPPEDQAPLGVLAGEREAAAAAREADLEARARELELDCWSRARGDQLGGPGNCCLCASYLSSPAKLMPLACCPAALPACCPIVPPPSKPMVREFDPTGELSSLQGDDEQPPPPPPAAGDDTFCCPIWRSMMFNYCQPLSLYPAAPVQQPPPLAYRHQDRLENFSSSHQQQVRQHQHQHNTTIDLKIEIGTNFKQKRSGSKRSLERTPDDSLESDQTDDSLIKQTEFERDSCDG